MEKNGMEVFVSYKEMYWRGCGPAEKKRVFAVDIVNGWRCFWYNISVLYSSSWELKVKFSKFLHFHIVMILKSPFKVTVHLEMETLSLFILPHFQIHMTGFPSTKWIFKEYPGHFFLTVKVNEDNDKIIKVICFVPYFKSSEGIW